jgi:LysR family transcriptional regulator, hypochlorite-specific transcription factor HypT
MNLEWLEDFIAVTQSGTFARASELRHGSQPALSRRIKLLEEWVGVPLLERGQHRIALTAAGDRFLAVAQDVVGRVRVGREAARDMAEGAARSIQFASTHVLALTFFPSWLRILEEQKPIDATIKLIADNMVACEQIMLDGKAQFLLCHHHALANNRLNDGNFSSVQLSTDILLPVSAPREAGGTTPLYAFPGTAERPTPHLGYSDQSGMGRIITAAAGEVMARASLRPIFESHLATVLLSMARDRRGVAWLPASLISEDLKSGRLVRAGGAEWDVPIEIHLFRSRSRQSAVAERLWSLVRERTSR